MVIQFSWRILWFEFFSDEKRSGQQPTLIVSLRDPYTKAIFQENTRRSFQYNLDPSPVRLPDLSKLRKL